MSEKDRLGDKLREKGKADEDRYFAEQDKKNLERIRNAAGPGATHKCPRDGADLVETVIEKVTVDLCPACKGIWLDKGELEALIHHHGEPGVTRWVRSLLK